MKIFLKILNSKSNELIYQMLWLLSHLVGESINTKKAFIDYGIIGRVLELIEADAIPENILRHGLWFISCLVKAKTEMPYQIVL
jgi:hypothetical protein